MDPDGTNLLRHLPSVDDVLRSAAAADLAGRFPHWAVAEAARAEIEERRRGVREGRLAHADDAARPVAREALSARVETLLRPSLRPVLNATGVVLHTNLGRAPLAERALARVVETARGYSTLEYDPAQRERGSRHDHVAGLLAALTGAEAACVVNNNAGAVLAALAALAAGREVVVSRGELVEIGGGFRVPDVMRSSGARLVEVGTTNKTRLRDYTSAVGADTALLLKVHRSNFAVVGFTEDVAVAELAAAARPRGLPVMVDLGSGALVDLARHGLPPEPTVASVVAAGADLVTFSGDKLLGGPQAGVVVGRRDAVERVRSHPLMRALRPDKMTVAALEATLEIYRDGLAEREIPALRMLATPLPVLDARKEALLAGIRADAPGMVATARRVRSAVGGGALPLAEPETWAVALRDADASAETLADRLAACDPPLIGRITGGELLLDVRTLADADVALAVRAVAAAARAKPGTTRGAAATSGRPQP